MVNACGCRIDKSDALLLQIAILDDPQLVPPGWAEEKGPANFSSFTDISIYELHVRDFSASDPTVPESVRGKFVAFAEPDTAGVRHLKELASAGITHVHLLPTYDFGSVPELPENQRQPQVGIEGLFVRANAHPRMCVCVCVCVCVSVCVCV
jgi:pullulanase